MKNLATVKRPSAYRGGAAVARTGGPAAGSKPRPASASESGQEGESGSPAAFDASSAPETAGEASATAAQAFRVLLNGISEGAVIVSTDGTILFANEAFAHLVHSTPQRVIAAPVLGFLTPADQQVLAPLLRRKTRPGTQVVANLVAADGGRTPVHFSIVPLNGQGGRHRTTGLIVTGTADGRPGEAELRSLTHHVVQAHEAERSHVALELHQEITQVLCGILFRCQKLARQIPAEHGAARHEADRIGALVGQVAEEVERISRSLRPSVLDNLGLIAALGATHEDFVARTGICLKVSLNSLTVPLSAEADIALYRIHQEALRNIERHASASRVTVSLARHQDGVRLTIEDDGAGFNPAAAGREAGIGIVSMRERAAAVGGVLQVESAPGKGCLIQAQIPGMNRIRSHSL